MNKSNKILRAILILVSLTVLAGVSLLSYVYFNNTGVSYTGKVRFDYNWDYVFAEKPEFEYKYDGKYFSFSYLTGKEGNQVRAFDEKDGGSLFGDLLDVYWDLSVPSEISSELTPYLSSKENSNWTPSDYFVKWLLGHNPGYGVSKTVRTFLADGTPAAIIYLKTKKSSPEGNYRLLIAEHGGVVVKIINLAGSSLSQEESLRFRDSDVYAGGRQVRPSGARDWRSLCIFRRVIETFEFKN